MVTEVWFPNRNNILSIREKYILNEKYIFSFFNSNNNKVWGFLYDLFAPKNYLQLDHALTLY